MCVCVHASLTKQFSHKSFRYRVRLSVILLLVVLIRVHEYCTIRLQQGQDQISISKQQRERQKGHSKTEMSACTKHRLRGEKMTSAGHYVLSHMDLGSCGGLDDLGWIL